MTPAPPPPPRPQGARKVKDGMPTTKWEVFILGFLIGALVGQLIQMLINSYAN